MYSRSTRSKFAKSKSQAELSLFEKIWKQLNHSKNDMQFRSRIVEEYYLEVLTPQTKYNLRNSLKIVIIFWYVSTYVNQMFSPGRPMSVLLGMITLLSLMGIYMCTLFVNTSRRVISLTTLLMLILCASNILNTFYVFGMNEVNFTPVVQVGILTFANLPIKLNNIIVLSVLSFFAFIVSASINILRKIDLYKFHTNDGNEHHHYGYEPFPMSGEETNVFRFAAALIILGCGVIVISTYLFFLNNIHRRAAFVRLGYKIKAKKQSRAEIKIQLKWIETIMPVMVKDDYFKHLDQIKGDKWVYVKAFDNVSILFADIVGFTNMSSNKTAPQVVMLLNDLFNRFDEMCNRTNCEKLGTLGDCYYCVAGCPVPRPDHALCCIEMGLGMCRIIKKFNHDHKEDVNMRVGIHTGRVNAAIIGKQRFRFDVYSNDVIIANTMESSGRPGRVHISQSTYELVRHSYEVEAGSDLEIKREEDHGIAGMLLKSFFIQTYYVDPMSSHLTPTNKSTVKNVELKVLTSQQRISSSNVESKETEIEEEDFPSVELDVDRQEYHNRLNNDIAFIDGLKYDPEHQIEWFSNPPLRTFTMMFQDREIEWHFSAQSHEYVEEVSLDSMKLAPFLDSLMCCFYTFIIFIVVAILFPEMKDSCKRIICGNSLLSLSLVIILFWHSISSHKTLNSNLERFIYVFFANRIIKTVICLHFVSSPAYVIYLTLYDCTKLNINYYYTIKYFTVTFFSLFVIPLFVSANYIVKTIFCLANVGLAFITLTIRPCKLIFFNFTFPVFSCFGQENITDVYFYSKIRFNFAFQVIITLILLLLLIREIELNMRIWFHIARETEIGREEATRMMKNSEEMLYNIIPNYVFNELKNQSTNQAEITNYNYALAVPNAAVSFACISNFFSKYYREDYKGGENALKLLHKIICSFDNIMKKKRYKDVEKIKTINDCYMVASGLNVRETNRNTTRNFHLNALMYYGFDLIRTLDNFNKSFIIGTDKFQIKIGYNFGPVTAGIIGTTKPMYDIWGDTVNVSSRMYSTGIPGKIQVPHYVSDELSRDFNFKYRGLIFVKGKGDMKTFICLGPNRHTKKYPVKPDIATYLTDLSTFTSITAIPNISHNEIEQTIAVDHEDFVATPKKSKASIATKLAKNREKKKAEMESRQEFSDVKHKNRLKSKTNRKRRESNRLGGSFKE